MAVEHSIPPLDLEPSSSPSLHRRKSKELAPLRFCLGLVLLAVGAVIAIFAWTLGTLAMDQFGKARNPHLAHQPPKNQSMESMEESNLVRSFFGEPRDGGVDHFDLVATIYHRVMVANSTKVSSARRPEAEEALWAMVVTEEGEEGRKELQTGKDDELVWGAWQRVFSEVVLEGLSLKSTAVKTVAKVILPGRIMPSLRNSTRPVSLWAAFTIIPSSLNSADHLIPINSTYYLSLDSSKNDTASDLPAPWPAIGDTVAAQNLVQQALSWKHRLRRYPATQDLLCEVTSYTEEDNTRFGTTGPELSLLDESVLLKENQGREGKAHAIISRSMVTMVQDTAVYALPAFQKQMRLIGESQRICNLFAQGKMSHFKGKMPNCQQVSSFAGRGHFQSLFEMGSEQDATRSEQETARQERAEDGEESGVGSDRRVAKGWRYGPYMQTSLGSRGPTDLIQLNTGISDVVDDEPNFSFDWHLTFSTASPLKVALGSMFSNIVNGKAISSNRSAHDIAGGQDSSELLNTVLGHPSDPRARPILRNVLRTLSNVLTFVSVLCQAHFWVTRSVTTGISMHAQVIDSIYNYIFFIWQCLRDGSGLWFWPGLVLATICYSVIWSLALRLEFSWWGWIPTRVSRRKASHSERASARLDMRFDWKQRVTSFFMFFASTLLVSKFPHLIHATPPLPLTPPAGAILFDEKTWYLEHIGTLDRTVYLALFAAQFLLNNRHGTFGANYRFVAAINLVSYVVHALPVLLSSRWGRWELMDPWEASDLGMVAVQGLQAWQAWKLPEVKQEEEEDE